MIYFYFGDNLYALEEKLKLFRERYHEKFSSGLNFWKLDFQEDDVGRLRDIVEIQSMFDEKKLIFARGATDLSSDDWDGVEEIVKNNKLKKSEDVVVVFYDKKSADDPSNIGTSIDKRKKAFKYLKKEAKSEEFKTPTGARLLGWIKAEVRKREGEIEDVAVRELVNRVGPNALQLIREIEKLIIYKAGKKIDQTDVNKLVNRTANPNVFETLDSLARRDVPVAIHLLHDHLEKGDDAIQLLGMFAWEVRNLILVKEAAEITPNPGQIASSLKIHPFVARKTLGFVQNFSMDELIKMHNLLARADIAIKTGKKEPELALEDFVYSFL